jgi:membrane-bound ClpP family serine protease
MDARAQPLVGELLQGVGCRPFLDQRADVLGLIRWVSHPGVCRRVTGVPGSATSCRNPAGRWRLAVLGLLALGILSAPPATQTARPVVYVVPIAGMIDLGLAPFVQRVLPRLPFGRRLVLETEMAADSGYASAPERDRHWLGKRGTAASPLRPAGLAHIDDERVDVVSDGEFIDAGEPLEVIRVDGNRIVVRRSRGTAGKE